jgi:hypothetical protein
MLHADAPARLADAPPEVAEHVAGCAECREFAERLGRLEQRWRNEPLPPSAHAARDAFLQRLPQPEPSRPRRRWVAPPRWAIAASLLMALGVCAWLFSQPRQAHAEDVVDRLIDWNMQLSDAGPEERAKLYAARVDAFKADVERAPLPEEDRSFAEALLQTSTFLVSTTEPLEEADRFNVLADQAVDRMHIAAAKRDARAAEKLARQYQRLAAKTFEKLDRAKPAAQQGEKMQRFERELTRELKRQERLKHLHDAGPAETRKPIKKLLDESKPRPKKPAGKANKS